MNGQGDEFEVPVLIAGGSLVGLSTALLFASHGVESLVVELFINQDALEPIPRARAEGTRRANTVPHGAHRA